MVRKDISTSWDRENRNAMNSNFKELYGLVGESYSSSYGLHNYFSLETGEVMTFSENGKEMQAEEIIEYYDGFMQEHPGYISKEKIGDGAEGTDLFAYTFKPEIYDLRSDGIKFDIPKIIISSGTHGNEKSALLGTLNLMDFICNRWGSDGVLNYLRHNVEIRVIPTLNPSGVNNYTRVNANGVDLNRDFPRGIDPEKDYSDRESETQAIIGYMKKHNDADLWIDHHNKVNDDSFFYVTGRNKLVNKTGAYVMATVGRLFSSRFDFLPSDDEYVYGFNTLGAQNTVTDCNNESGIPAMTLETISKLPNDPDNSFYNDTVQTLTVEYAVNMIRENLKNIELEKTLAYIKE